jgi:hypothetical protein
MMMLMGDDGDGDDDGDSDSDGDGGDCGEGRNGEAYTSRTACEVEGENGGGRNIWG